MIERWIAASTAYLASAKARESLARDPYWPKWNSPWWHMTLLFELDRADAIPKEAAEAMLAAIEAKYPRWFPNPREPLPPGKDYHRDGLCHCGLGNMAQTLAACGLDLETRAPWMGAWFLRYQLPDGGLNCDERAYAIGTASSIQSTLPALEAVVRTPRPLTLAEEEFVDRGARYLIERRLACRRGDGRPMSEEFLKIGFPRFYDYDVLRGLSFLAAWSRVRRRPVPREAVLPSLSALSARFPDGRIRVEKPGLAAEGSLNPSEDGAWARGAASSFPLLDSARRAGAESEALSRRWAEVRSTLGRLER
ncbi:MAG TPA: hypothetical protein VH309_07420 [Elusimicrobiota bacterium]|nr:hypothetical protein [Elusimicrobiota bacterium]